MVHTNLMGQCGLQKAKKLPPTWKYESATASALVA